VSAGCWGQMTHRRQCFVGWAAVHVSRFCDSSKDDLGRLGQGRERVWRKGDGKGGTGKTRRRACEFACGCIRMDVCVHARGQHAHAHLDMRSWARADR